jgi:hypothetical protein
MARRPSARPSATLSLYWPHRRLRPRGRLSPASRFSLEFWHPVGTETLIGNSRLVGHGVGHSHIPAARHSACRRRVGPQHRLSRTGRSAGQARRWNGADRMTTQKRHPAPARRAHVPKVAPRALTPAPPPPMAADCCGTLPRGGVEIGAGNGLRLVLSSVPNHAPGSTSCAASFADRAGAHALRAAGGHGHDGLAVAAVQAPRWPSKKRLEWAVQGHFNAPAKRLRAEHRRPHTDRRTHGQFRPSDGRAVPPKEHWNTGNGAWCSGSSPPWQTTA